jgi:hypothetical protein
MPENWLNKFLVWSWEWWNGIKTIICSLDLTCNRKECSFQANIKSTLFRSVNWIGMKGHPSRPWICSFWCFMKSFVQCIAIICSWILIPMSDRAIYNEWWRLWIWIQFMFSKWTSKSTETSNLLTCFISFTDHWDWRLTFPKIPWSWIRLSWKMGDKLTFQNLMEFLHGMNWEWHIMRRFSIDWSAFVMKHCI